MSIKDLFDKYTHGQFQKAVTLESGSLLVESAEFINSIHMMVLWQRKLNLKIPLRF